MAVNYSLQVHDEYSPSAKEQLYDLYERHHSNSLNRVWREFLGSLYALWLNVSFKVSNSRACRMISFT